MLISRRRNATRETTALLKDWLDEHRQNPYPTKGEKIMLSIISKMNMTQVSTWFANARRRMKKDNRAEWIGRPVAPAAQSNCSPATSTSCTSPSATSGGGGGSTSTSTATTTATIVAKKQPNASILGFIQRHRRRLGESVASEAMLELINCSAPLDSSASECATAKQRPLKPQRPSRPARRVAAAQAELMATPLAPARKDMELASSSRANSPPISTTTSALNGEEEDDFETETEEEAAAAAPNETGNDDDL